PSRTRLPHSPMSHFDPSDPRPVHLVGVAGAGMSALAELLARRGIAVTGCDAGGGATPDLDELGMPIFRGHDPAHVEGARLVIVTSAVPTGHAELEHARALGIPVLRRAEALAEAVAVGDVVAIAGTHGKTTTTVMTTDALAAAGFEPTGVAGGRVGAWNGNVRHGASQLFVVEADEDDHLDIYADLDDIRVAFAQFVHGARAIVLCADDAGASTLVTPPTAEVIRYSIQSPDARLVARDVRVANGGSSFTVIYDNEVLGEAVLRVP